MGTYSSADRASASTSTAGKSDSRFIEQPTRPAAERLEAAMILRHRPSMNVAGQVEP